MLAHFCVQRGVGLHTRIIDGRDYIDISISTLVHEFCVSCRGDRILHGCESFIVQSEDILSLGSKEGALDLSLLCISHIRACRLARFIEAGISSVSIRCNAVKPCRVPRRMALSWEAIVDVVADRGAFVRQGLC